MQEKMRSIHESCSPDRFDCMMILCVPWRQHFVGAGGRLQGELQEWRKSILNCIACLMLVGPALSHASSLLRSARTGTRQALINGCLLLVSGRTTNPQASRRASSGVFLGKHRCKAEGRLSCINQMPQSDGWAAIWEMPVGPGAGSCRSMPGAVQSICSRPAIIVACSPM